MGWQPSKNPPKPLLPRPRKSDVEFEVNPPNDVEIELIVRRYEYDDGRGDKMLGKDYFDIEWEKPNPVGCMKKRR